MSSRVVLSVILFYSQMVAGEYGEKLKPNVTESLSSSEEYHDDSSDETSTTASEDGVIVENSIFVAEITPKASYSLVDSPKGLEQSLGAYTAGRFNGNNQGPPGYSRPNYNRPANCVSSILGNTQSTTSLGKNPLRSVTSSSSSNKIHEYPQKPDVPYFRSSDWSLLGLNPNNHHQKRPFSSTYRNPNDLEITSAKVTELQKNGVGLYSGGSHDPFPNGNVLDFGYQSTNQEYWNPYDTQAKSKFLAKMEEANSKFQQNQISKIEATKLYLKQAKGDQEYALRLQALKNAAHTTFQTSRPTERGWSNGVPPSARGREPSRSNVVGTTETLGVGKSVSGNGLRRKPLHSSQDALFRAIHAFAGHRWRSTLAERLPTTIFYTEPSATPVVLPSGFLADTDEVTVAKIAHLQALTKSIESASLWKTNLPKR